MNCYKYDKNIEMRMEMNLFDENNNDREKKLNKMKNIKENKIRNPNLSINIQNGDKSSSNIIKHEKKEKIFGLKNIGLTCYMNSFLQILFHCPQFMEEIEKYSVNSFKNSILYNFKRIIKNPERLNLEKFKSSLNKIEKDYSEFIQNDSQKFGIDLIDAIISEIKNEKYLTTESQTDSDNSNIIDPKKMYQIYIKQYQYDFIPLEKMLTMNQYYIQEKNNKKKIIFENSISVDLLFPEKKHYFHSIPKYNLKQLLDLKYKIKKTIKICKCPDILIITIDRAVLEKKNTYHPEELEYTEILELKEYTDKDIIKYDKCQYRLFGVNKKEGYYMNSGHYYCEIKINNIWYRFNDLNVTNDINFENKSSEVVGLFYVKNKN